MANKLIVERQRTGERSPTDPQACCDWANARMLARDPSDERRWVTTGDPQNPIRLSRP